MIMSLDALPKVISGSVGHGHHCICVAPAAYVSSFLQSFNAGSDLPILGITKSMFGSLLHGAIRSCLSMTESCCGMIIPRGQHCWRFSLSVLVWG